MTTKRYRQVFGVPLGELPTGESNIPVVVDRLITTLEMTGLYTEGLYRKSGLSSKVIVVLFEPCSWPPSPGRRK